MSEPQNGPFPGEPAGSAQGARPWASQYPAPGGAPPWGAGDFPPSGPPSAPKERDRIAVHLVWEGVLALAVIGVVTVLVLQTGGQGFANMLNRAGILGLMAAGFAFSLRTGSPNLAVGCVSVATGALGAQLAVAAGWPLPVAMATAIGAATILGLVIGAVVMLLSVPAWAATLGGGFVLWAATFGIAGLEVVMLPSAGNISGSLWFGLFVVVSVGGGALWCVPGVRRALSADRSAGRAGQLARPGMGALVGITGSSLLAAMAGAANAMHVGAVGPATDVFALTLTALAVALLGGVSVFGRRAGVFGTLLAVLMLASVELLLNFRGVEFWVNSLFTGCVLLFGLGVSRTLETVTDRLNGVDPASATPRSQP